MNEPGGSRTANLGETLDIVLKALPGAGYTWKVESGYEAILELIGTSWEPLGQQMGAPSDQRFTFRAVHRGSALVRFTYGREWEHTHQREQTIPIVVD